MKKDLISVLKLDIRESEKGIFSLLTINSLFSGLSTAFLFVVTNSYFIKNLSVDHLPVAFIFSGLVGLLLVQLYKKLVNWKGLIFSYLTMGILFSVVCIFLFYLRILGTQNTQIIFITAYLGFVFTMPFISVFTLAFSSVGFKVFDLNQGKRLFALVGMGEIIANIISYLLIPSLVSWWGGSEYLLLLSMVARLISLVPLGKIKIPQINLFEKNINSIKKVNFSLLVKDSYYLIMSIVTFCSVFAIFLVDYTYLLTVKFISVENNVDAAILFSLVFCVVKIGELIASIYSARFNSFFGLKISLIILPIILVISSILGFVTGLFMSSQILIVTSFLLLNKIFERAIRKGILAPSQKVLFQVAKSDEREKIQTLIDGSISQMATLISGVILLFFSIFFRFSSSYYYLFVLAFICFIFSIGWFLATQGLYNRYKSKIQYFLKKGLLTKSSNENYSPVSSWIASIPKKEVNTKFIQDVYSQLLNIEHQIQSNPNAFFLDQIKHLNPREFKHLQTIESNQIFGLFSKLFFHKDSFDSRMSIIFLTSHFTNHQKFTFIKENYKNLNHHLQHALIVELAKDEGLYLTDSAERFYISELCVECCELIFWAELAMDDLKDYNAQELSLSLIIFRRLNILHLFELLKLMYNASSISIIVDVWKNSSESVENEAFTIELLENLLDGDLKKIIVPLLTDMPIDLKRTRLGELLNAYSLDFSERLIDIMLKSILNVDSSIKVMAAKLYAEKSANSSILNYYSHDLNVRLQSLADGGISQSVFNKFTSELRSKLYLTSNPNHIFTEDFLFHSFFEINSQFSFIKKSKIDQQIDQSPIDYLIKIEIDEIEYTISTYNLFLFLYITFKL